MTDINWELIVAVGLAFIGFQQWRSELIGKKRAEIAERAIVLTNKAKHAIAWARFPGGYAGEGQTRPLTDVETKDNRDSYKDSIFIKIERINGNQEIFKELSEITYLFHAYFGDVAQKYFDDIIMAQRTVISSAYSLIRYDGKLKNDKLQTKYENNIDAGMEEDTITVQVQGAVDAIEEICSPIIRGMYKPTILKLKDCLVGYKYTFLNWFKTRKKKGKDNA